MSCKLKVVVSLLRIIATLLSLRPFGNINVSFNLTEEKQILQTMETRAIYSLSLMTVTWNP